MSVRIATPEDYQPIHVSNNHTDPKENSAWFPPAIREDIRRGRVIFDPQTNGFLNFYPVSKGDPRVSIYNLYVPKGFRGSGSGKRMVDLLKSLFPTTKILAKCPQGIRANDFYEKEGFVLEEVLQPEGRRKVTLNVWVWRDHLGAELQT